MATSALTLCHKNYIYLEGEFRRVEHIKVVRGIFHLSTLQTLSPSFSEISGSDVGDLHAVEQFLRRGRVIVIADVIKM